MSLMSKYFCKEKMIFDLNLRGIVPLFVPSGQCKIMYDTFQAFNDSIISLTSSIFGFFIFFMSISPYLSDKQESESESEHLPVPISTPVYIDPPVHMYQQPHIVGGIDPDRVKYTRTIRLSLCSICYDKTATLSLSCGHAFHEGCIGVWFQRHKTCPNCRQIPEMIS